MHACAVVDRAHLAEVRVMVDSVHRHHRDASAVVLVVDEPGAPRPSVAGAEVVLLDEVGLGPGRVDELTTACAPTELADALVPVLLRWVLDRGRDHVVHLAPSMVLAREVAELPGLARAHSVLLVPRLTEPVPRDGRLPDESTIMAAGAFDPGLVAVGDTPGGRAMLDWWADRFPVGTGDGQHVLDLVPGLFDHHVVRDPSWDVAWWNLATRPLTRHGEEVLVAGRPLTSLHLAGFDPDRPHLLSRDQGPEPRVLLSEDPVLRSLCREHAERLRRAGAGTGPEATTGEPFAERGGVRLTPLVRDLVRDELRRRGAAADPDGSGLAVGRSEGFELATWLAAADPATSAGGLGRLLSAVHRQRPDLRAAFPEVASGELEGLLAWAADHGVDELGLPVETIELERERFAARDRSGHLLHEPPPAGRRRRVHGVEVTGYFSANLGLGQAGREVVAGLVATGHPVTTTTWTRVGDRVGVPWEDLRGAPDERSDILLLCVNPDQLPSLLEEAPPGYTYGRHRIGLWFWELEEPSTEMLGCLDLVDEVWVTSEFNAGALRPHTSKPVVVLPLPVHAPMTSAVRIPEVADPTPTTFLFVFDHLSVAERKNPWGVVEAFCRAFPAPGRARLVIKSSNAHWRPLERERLRCAVADRPDVVLVERHLTRDELDGLFHAADCYVSLHRSEGFGLTLAEAMAAGVPVIGTGWSGSSAFLDTTTGLVVRHSIVPVPPGCDPYPETGHWAEPDLDHAAELMRRVLGDPASARALGRAGAARIAADFSTEALAAAASARLAQVWADLDEKRARRRRRRERRGARSA